MDADLRRRLGLGQAGLLTLLPNLPDLLERKRVILQLL